MDCIRVFYDENCIKICYIVCDCNLVCLKLILYDIMFCDSKKKPEKNKKKTAKKQEKNQKKTTKKNRKKTNFRKRQIDFKT